MADDLPVDLAGLEIDVRVQVVEVEILRPCCSLAARDDLYAGKAESVQQVVGERRAAAVLGRFATASVRGRSAPAVSGVSVVSGFRVGREASDAGRGLLALEG